LRVEFLLKTDSGYPKDTGVKKPWQPLGIPFAITPIGQLHQSPPSPIQGLRVQFLLKTDSGYPKDTVGFEEFGALSVGIFVSRKKILDSFEPP